MTQIAKTLLPLVGLMLLGACSKYPSYLDCLNGELKGKSDYNQQKVAIAYCQSHYKMTDKERKLLGG